MSTNESRAHGERNSFVIQIMKVIVTRPVMRMKTECEKGGDKNAIGKYTTVPPIPICKFLR